MIIFKYLAKQVYTTLIGVTGILLLIFIGNAFIHYLTRAAQGKLNTAVIIKLVALQIPFLLGLLLPMALFISFMLVYGRMYADSEMVVLQAGGFSPKKLLNYSMILTSLILVINIILVFLVSPRLIAYKFQLLAEGKSGSFFSLLKPGQFQYSEDGRSVYYIESMNNNGTVVRHVFIAERGQKANNPWVITAAASGHVAISKNQDSYFVTDQGYRYYGVPGQANFKVITFGTAARRINDGPIVARQTTNAMDNRSLWQTRKDNPDALAELQWRASVPLSTLIFSLLVIPLSRVTPRQGRYNRLLPAALLYAIYVNFMFVARNWVATGKVSPWIGMWWLPLLLAVATLLFWYWPQKRIFLARFKAWWAPA